MSSNPTLFQQKVSPYNPFRPPASPELARLCAPTVSVDTFLRALRLCLPYVPVKTLKELQTTCAGVDAVVREYVWRRPAFHASPTADALTLFQRFLVALPGLRQATRSCIRDLQLTGMDESMYERVPKDFFTQLLRYTPALLTLNLARASFFDRSNLPKTAQSFAQLTTLDVSGVEHMSDPLLLQLALLLPQLRLVRLDNTRVNHGVGQLAYHCDHLHSLSLKKTLLTDEALVAIAKFRKIYLTELDIAFCAKVTEAGLTMLARYCTHLSWFGVANSPISLATLRRWDHRFWKYLDISHCEQLHKDIASSTMSSAADEAPSSSSPSSDASKPATKDKHDSLYDLLMNAPQLQHLSLSMPVMRYLLATSRAHQAQGTITAASGVRPSPLNRLILHDLPEHSPLTLIDDIVALFPRISYIKMVRGYYENDFMLGTYSQSTRSIDDKTRQDINDRTIKAYTPVHATRPLTLVLENQRDLVPGLGMEYW
ncbi:hypothetical protein BC940DRAFT_297288 [Gongronella butleri]|nr:hypothetical protein BC940DRAFT_297288 [Gongronella butleri]